MPETLPGPPKTFLQSDGIRIPLGMMLLALVVEGFERLGYKLTEDQNTLLLQLILVVIGAVGAMWGRAKATRPIEGFIKPPPGAALALLVCLSLPLTQGCSTVNIPLPGFGSESTIQLSDEEKDALKEPQVVWANWKAQFTLRMDNWAGVAQPDGTRLPGMRSDPSIVSLIGTDRVKHVDEAFVRASEAIDKADLLGGPFRDVAISQGDSATQLYLAISDEILNRYMARRGFDPSRGILGGN